MVVQVCNLLPYAFVWEKKHLEILFSKTEDALWLNLCIYYWEHLHVCSRYVTLVSKPWPVGLLFKLSDSCKLKVRKQVYNNALFYKRRGKSLAESNLPPIYCQLNPFELQFPERSWICEGWSAGEMFSRKLHGTYQS